MYLLISLMCLSVVVSFPMTKNENETKMISLITTYAPIVLETSKTPEKDSINRNVSPKHENIIKAVEKINSLKDGRSRTFGSFASFAAGGLLAALDLIEDLMVDGKTSNIEEEVKNFIILNGKELNQEVTESSTNLQVTTEFSNPSTIQTTTDSFGFTFTNIPTTTIPTTTTKKITLDILRENIKNNSNLLSQRQAKDSENEIESRQEEDEEEGGGGGLIGAIISGFLGSLSKPDGGVDVDAVVSVIASLSAQREDGTYDFTGLADTLNAFFGGDEDGGGGSDVGSFVGGLLAAMIRGSANPPGAKGAGTFVGNIAKQVLPAISGPAPLPEGVTTIKPQVDAGGFLGSLLNSIFGTPANGSNGSTSPFHTIKTNLFKFVFSALSSIVSSSSSASSKGTNDKMR